MARNVVVRPATAEDFVALEPLWLELALMGPGSQSGVERTRSRWERSWLEADATYVASIDRTPVGMIALTVQDTGAWTGRVLVMTVLYVAQSAQHKGVGNALLEVAAEFALASGVEAVAVDVPPSMREANRFFARVGFAPMVTRRVIPSASLKRRLDAAPGGRMARLRARSAARRASARPGAVSP
jgi:GNAT superfamily N-acetyltransferase